MSNLLICAISEHNFLHIIQRNPLPLILNIKNKCINQITVIKPINHRNTEHYRRSADCFEVDLELDLNHLVSGNLWKHTTVPSQFDELPRGRMWLILYI